MTLALAIDAGTTGVRTFAVDATGTPRHVAYREFTQHFPKPGWVEHDASEILAVTIATLTDVRDWAKDHDETVATIGITNQRETVVAWDRHTGTPSHRAIVWQDRRTAARCDELKSEGVEDEIRGQTGLVLDPYFSATKMEWLLTQGGVTRDASLALATIDTWLLWHLTGGVDGGVFATEPSNASRTMLYDLSAAAWSDALCDRFSVPRHALPDILPSSGRFGISSPSTAAGLSVPVSGIAGDQQAALFGQACFDPGMAKNTYGTGSFVLVNVGREVPLPAPGLLTTVAWDLGSGPVHAMEGAIFATGAAIQWLRDGLGIIDDASETGPLAESVPDAGGVFFVPAFTGLGSPWWDPYARGMIIGLSRGTTRAHLARAVVEAMAFQTRDVVDAITAASGTPPAELRVDGGASVMDVLCQLQANVLDVPVRRAAVSETTALGAAYLAGIAEDVWDVDAVSSAWRADRSFEPQASANERDVAHAAWLRAVERSREWATED